MLFGANEGMLERKWEIKQDKQKKRKYIAVHMRTVMKIQGKGEC